MGAPVAESATQTNAPEAGDAIDRYIDGLLATAPALSPDQVDRLRGLLGPAVVLDPAA